jgi:hypothetical protein
MSQQGESLVPEARPGRRPYQAPKLTSVDLKAEEVLAQGCKTPVLSAFGSIPCYANNCALSGS